VVIAQLISLNRSDPTETISAAHHSVLSFHLRPLSQAAVGAAALLLGGVIVLHAWQADRTHRLRVGAFLAVHPSKTREPDYERGRVFLEAAVATSPDDADARLELGQIFLDLRQVRIRQWNKEQGNSDKGETGKEQRDPEKGRAKPAAGAPDAEEATRLPPAQEAEFFQEFVVPGLQHLGVARNLCPLLARPHIRFAAFADKLVRADPPSAYWARARLLAPFDADLWYFSGVQQLKDGQPDEAWKSWRRSLELSGRYLDQILDTAGPRLASDLPQRVERLNAEILPDNPELILRTALRLVPNPTPDSPVRPLLDRGLELLTSRTDVLSPSDVFHKARFHQFLGQYDAAIRDFDTALLRSANHPNNPRWRLLFVYLLIDQDKFGKALQELKVLQVQMPSDEVNKLIERVKFFAERSR
jgi:tetratricopeptide (TPR) repeat protein